MAAGGSISDSLRPSATSAVKQFDGRRRDIEDRSQTLSHQIKAERMPSGQR